MDILNQICLIVDFDGYVFQGEFKPREIGFCSLVHEDWNDSVLFDLSASFDTMTEKDKRTNSYVRNYVTGLTIRPLPWENCLRDESQTENVICQMYEENQTNEKYVVGYKGGEYEKKMLKKLNIPNVNLENFGCPKFENLLSVTHLNETEKSCGLHLPLKENPDKIVHCPRMETFVFAEWLKNIVKPIIE